MPTTIRFALCLTAAALAMMASVRAGERPNGPRLTGRRASPIRAKVTKRVLHEIDDRLFGQFMERPSWGETGVEAAVVDETGKLQPAAVKLLKRMRIPIVRFPGGTDADYTDWRDMVSNVPGRAGERPITVGHKGHKVTNRFGHDEYFALRDRMGWQTILVVNFLDALSKKKPPREAALLAAGLVAYCNAPVGTKLPKDMPDWPAVRARNGHPKPFRAEYFQIGNETWFFRNRLQTKLGLRRDAEYAAWYGRCLKAYVGLMRKVDPAVKIIIDGQMGGEATRMILADPQVRRSVDFVALHHYQPGPMDRVRRAGRRVPHGKLGRMDWWHAWVSMPGRFDANGRNVAFGPDFPMLRKLGYQIAATEWNWNGWGYQRLDPRPAVHWDVAAAVGVAGWIHGLMRHGDIIRIACQSMLIGNRWDITAVHVDSAGKVPPYYRPQGMATTFYNLHHGRRFLEVAMDRPATFAVPWQLGWAAPEKTVAYLDVVATADDDKLYVHAINRHLEQAVPIAVDLTAHAVGRQAAHHVLTGELDRPDPPKQTCRFERRKASIRAKTLQADLPARSASIFEIPIAP